MKPEILNPVLNKKRLEQLKRNDTIKIVDFLDNQLKELKNIKKTDLDNPDDVWVYYDWLSVLVHILNKNDYRLVRLSRNRNLITEEEQEKFSNQIIGIAGLNVGNPASICIALEGGAENMKFADNDVLELSNFNRFRSGLSHLGTNKVTLSARQVYEIDPFYEIDIFDKGISEENIDRFLTGPKIDLLIEEMDNLQLKVKIREKARNYRIPVVMVTGNGSGLIIDIERFDLEPNLPILNGYLKKDVMNRISALTNITPIQEKIFLARDFMGTEFLEQRLRESFNLVGKELAGIPQISESSFLRGAVLCYFARQIATGGKAPSGRYFLNLDSIV